VTRDQRPETRDERRIQRPLFSREHEEDRLAAVVPSHSSLVSRLSSLLLVALALGALAVALVFRFRPHRVEKSPAVSQSLPANAQQQLAGYSFTRSEGGRQIFTIRAQRTVAFKDNESTLLEGVEVEVFGRQGERHDLLNTDRCEYHSQSGSFSCAGRVLMELNAPSGSGLVAPPANAVSKLRGRHSTYLETSRLTYDQQSSMLTTAAPVRWRYGPASGSAVGLAYATSEGWMELQHDVTANLPVGGTGVPPVVRGSSALHLTPTGETPVPPNTLHLTAARLVYHKDQQQMELAGPVEITAGSRQLDAGHGTVYLDAENRLSRAVFDEGVHSTDHTEGRLLTAQAERVEADFDSASGDLKQLEASGSVQTESQQGPAGGTTRLAADQVRVSFSGAHFHPQQGSASGKVNLVMTRPAKPASDSGPQGAMAREELEAGAVEFSFRSADSTLERAHTEGPGKLTLIPADAKAGDRVVTAGQFLMAFDGRSRLESLRGLAPTRVVFETPRGTPPGSPPTETRGDSLLARLDPVTGALQRLEQSGSFQLLDGDRQARASRADYSADGEVLTLTGEPFLFDPVTRMRADRFLVRLSTDTAEGLGHVSSTHFGPLNLDSSPPVVARTGAPPHSVDTTNVVADMAKMAMPPVVARASAPPHSDDITNVLADRVTADRKNQYLRYEGHVRAWQAADVVESPSLDVYRAERRIVSGAGVVTSGLASAPVQEDPTPAKSGLRVAARTPGATQPMTIRADRLVYLDIGQKASYRGHVRLDSSGTTLEADRLDAYFAPASVGEASKLERAVAEGHVTAVEPGRRATGDRGEYFAGAGKLVMTGGPPTLYDADKGFITGQSLTFFTQADSLIVVGGPGSPTLSKHHMSP
jgi:lipopolysaccharide export system protein LptA/lipopolysaccharide export system protein LptC